MPACGARGEGRGQNSRLVHAGGNELNQKEEDLEEKEEKKGPEERICESS